MIKIWDPSITLIQKIDLKIVNPLPDLNNQVSYYFCNSLQKAYGIQSIDAYM